MIKLDEARLLLNKLMGPQGPLSMAERSKFLAAGSGNTTIDNTINDRSAAFYTNGMGGNTVEARGRADTNNSSREAPLNQAQLPKSNTNGDDDEFWYNNGVA